MSNRRTGKIARLPKSLRDLVNNALRDGQPYAAIIKKLVAEGAGDDLNEQNLTNWKEGGFVDWTKEQERLEDMAAKRDFAMEVVKQNEGSKLHEATLHLAASQLYEALADFDIGNLKALLATNPENYAQIVNSLAKLSKGALDIERYREQVRTQREKIEGALAKAKDGGLTAETIATIEESLRLL